MTWFRIDDTWGTHPKVLACSANARLLWVYGGLYCSQHLTDGLIPKTAMKMLAATANVPARAASELLAAGLWTEVGDSYEVHQFLSYQPSRERVTADRAQAAERQKRARDRARESRQESRRDGTVSHGPPDPTRPDPTPTGYRSLTTTIRGLSASRRVVEVTRAIAAQRFATQQDREIIDDDASYLAGIERNVKAELGDRIVAVCNTSNADTLDDLVTEVLGTYDEGAA